jgi:uncharacterized protein
MRAYDRSSGRELAANLSVAATVCSRAKGLLGRKALAPGEGLWIKPCLGIHTFFMRFPIDVAFLDKQCRVIEVVHHLAPQRLTKFVPAAAGVIELPAGTLSASGTVVGNHIVID